MRAAASAARLDPVGRIGTGRSPVPARPAAPQPPPDRRTDLKPLSTLAAVAALALAATAPAAHAAAVVFDTAPFQGSNADPNDGIRTVFGGNERFLAGFDFAQDQFVFNPAAFGLAGPIAFASGLAAALPTSGADVIVLQSTDNDGNPATPFNAGSAATLIANALEADGAGFFVYHNSVLGVNRLVFSTNLNSATADLAILARITAPSGADAIAQLPGFGAANFTVPVPATWALAGLGLIGIAAVRRAPRRTVN